MQEFLYQESISQEIVTQANRTASKMWRRVNTAMIQRDRFLECRKYQTTSYHSKTSILRLTGFLYNPRIYPLLIRSPMFNLSMPSCSFPRMTTKMNLQAQNWVSSTI